MPAALTKDQRYTRSLRKVSHKLRHKGEITQRQITIRVGAEELQLLEIWKKQKELDMTSLLEEIISTMPRSTSTYATRVLPETKTGKRVAAGKQQKRICCWIRSTLHQKLEDHAKVLGLSMNRLMLDLIRSYRERFRHRDRLSLMAPES